MIVILSYQEKIDSLPRYFKADLKLKNPSISAAVHNLEEVKTLPTKYSIIDPTFKTNQAQIIVVDYNLPLIEFLKIYCPELLL